MKSVFKPVVTRIIITALLLLVQAVIIALLARHFAERYVWYAILCDAISIATVFALVRNNKTNPAYKLAWAIVLLILPVFGLLFYLIFGNRHLGRRARIKMDHLTARAAKLFFRKDPVMPYLEGTDADGAAQSKYLQDVAGYPLFRGTETQYLPSGKAYFRSLLADLESARSFIFLEYFIIGEGKMWQAVLDVLCRKVEEGVDVRLIYDDFGCLQSLPVQYFTRLRRMGIKCCVFNPIMPMLNSGLNNRDHRKICVIDGNVGYTGGINLADEYIGLKRRFGHWKDTGIRLYGDGVWGLTVMFLTMWSYLSGKNEPYDSFRPTVKCTDTAGFVQPYADSPLDNEHVGETAYMNMISRARRYVYITTPYLVLDNEMRTLLCNAAKSGVDVRIITPGIPDKRSVFAVTRANYASLLEAGVRIYEYTPGFVHAKSFVCDDKYAIVGTVNMDFRSFYLHFECGVFLCGNKCVADIRDDFAETQKKSREVSLQKLRDMPWYQRLAQSILYLFAPLM